MASIVIKDLKESVELDRKAMREIIGGWSQRGPIRVMRSSDIWRTPTSFDIFKFTGVASNVNKP
jgi:hypothetical protein